MPRLVQKRKQIDPKTLRKHSKIVQDRADPLLVVGNRNQTDYGYTIPGVTHKTFETFHMAVSASSTTPVWRHEKKTRVYRVVSGTGHYQRTVSENTAEARMLSAGDEVLVEAGHAHRLTASTKLELYVTQDSKYEANLEELAPVERLAEVQGVELQNMSAEEKALRMSGSITRRGRTRAAEQIALQRGEAPRPKRFEENSDNFFRNSTAGLNAMPISGFSEDGAG